LSPRRKDLPPLRREDLAADPFAQFAAWYERAASEVPLCDAMTLATVDEAGRPDARMVLLKGHGPDGFRFYTNLESAKGRQLADRPSAAIVVYWRELDRQVRARGVVETLPAEVADEYFATRPRDSQLGAWASAQSSAIGSREELERHVAELEREYEGREVPRPAQWGGFLLIADEVEFWQGRIGRLHDRFRYRREGGGWDVGRLAP
jgi:pyridoxamine 5'-phosphate oxidase